SPYRMVSVLGIWIADLRVWKVTAIASEPLHYDCKISPTRATAVFTPYVRAVTRGVLPEQLHNPARDELFASPTWIVNPIPRSNLQILLSFGLSRALESRCVVILTSPSSVNPKQWRAYAQSF